MAISGVNWTRKKSTSMLIESNPLLQQIPKHKLHNCSNCKFPIFQNKKRRSNLGLK